MNTVTIDDFAVGAGQPLTIIAGPCVIESLDLCHEVAANAPAAGIPAAADAL